ncbi:hypothetical protein ACFWYW_58675 [Nonomuraea sp. NPDC059023]|uniref:hypothetical protein n=1 Tax=unclassified Nonomuraea TaxID=2593643 RepID=UPI0036B9BDF2
MLTPERVIEVAIGLYVCPTAGADAPPAMARAIVEALADAGMVVVSTEDLRAVLVDRYSVEGRNAAHRLGDALPEKACNGICATARDLGADEYGDMIAHAHPECELHGRLVSRKDL